MAQARTEVEREELTGELRRHEERAAGIRHVAYRDPEAVQRACGEDAVEAHLRLVDVRRDARGGEHGGDVDAPCVMLILARARAVVDANWEALEHQGARVHSGQLGDASRGTLLVAAAELVAKGPAFVHCRVPFTPKVERSRVIVLGFGPRRAPGTAAIGAVGHGTGGHARLEAPRRGSPMARGDHAAALAVAHDPVRE